MPIKAVCSVVWCSCLQGYHWLPFVCMWTCKPIIICAFIVTCKCTLIQRCSTVSQVWQKQRLQIDCMTMNGNQWLPGVNTGKTFYKILFKFMLNAWHWVYQDGVWDYIHIVHDDSAVQTRRSVAKLWRQKWRGGFMCLTLATESSVSVPSYKKQWMITFLWLTMTIIFSLTGNRYVVCFDPSSWRKCGLHSVMDME